MKGGGYGLLGNIILGITGSFVGGWLLGIPNTSLNIGGSTITTIIQAVIGAIVVIFVAGLFKGR